MHAHQYIKKPGCGTWQSLPATFLELSYTFTLPKTNSLHLKIGPPWKRRFLLESTILRCYCWCKKSCATWDVWNLVKSGMNYLSTGAGFLPSTVIMLVLGSVYHIMWFFKLTWGFSLWHKIHRSWHLQQPPRQSGRIPRSPQRDAWSAVQDILHGPCVRETGKHCKTSQFHHFWPLKEQAALRGH